MVPEFFHLQAKGLNCRQASCTAGLLGSTFIYVSNRLMVHTSHTDAAAQKVVTTSLQPHPLYHLQYPALAGHPRKRCM